MRNRARQTGARLPSGTSCRSEKEPATYPRRPGRSRTAWTIPTVPCPSCQTASRRYAHSHRHPATKHLPCHARPLDLRVLADAPWWRPPPRNAPDQPPASRYSPAETTETANRHPSTHSATTLFCPSALLPTGSTASEARVDLHGDVARGSVGVALARAWPGGRRRFGKGRSARACPGRSTHAVGGSHGPAKRILSSGGVGAHGRARACAAER
jgi:hypothetical protein